MIPGLLYFGTSCHHIVGGVAQECWTPERLQTTACCLIWNRIKSVTLKPAYTPKNMCNLLAALSLLHLRINWHDSWSRTLEINSAVSTSVKKHFSPHSAVSSLSTTLTHSVAASGAEWVCCRRAQAQRSSFATRRHLQVPGWWDLCAMGEGWHCSLQPAPRLGACEQMLSRHSHRVLLVLQLLQLFLHSKLNGESNSEPSGAENSYRILLSFPTVFSTCFYSCLCVLEGLMFHRFVFSASSPEKDPSRI